MNEKMKEYLQSSNFMSIVVDEIVDNYDVPAEACPEGLIYGVAASADILNHGDYEMDEILAALEENGQMWHEIVEQAIQKAEEILLEETAEEDRIMEEIEAEELEVEQFEREAEEIYNAEMAEWLASMDEE